MWWIVCPTRGRVSAGRPATWCRGISPPAQGRGRCGLRAADPAVARVGPVLHPRVVGGFDRGVCIRRSDDIVLDFAVRLAGTFLIRSYDRKRTALGLYDHSRQLAQLWGVDIAPFPAELATINLFRADGRARQLPRILNDDFNVVPGGHKFPPLKAAPGPTPDLGELETLKVSPGRAEYKFDVVGNFPYIGAARIEEAPGRRAIEAHRTTAGRVAASLAGQQLPVAGRRWRSSGWRWSKGLESRPTSGRRNRSSPASLHRPVRLPVLACRGVLRGRAADGHRHFERLARRGLWLRPAALLPGSLQGRRDLETAASPGSRRPNGQHSRVHPRTPM